jgi:hypothetical protein
MRRQGTENGIGTALIVPLHPRALTPCTLSGSEGRSLHDVLVDAILYIKALKARDEAAGTIVCVCVCVCVRVRERERMCVRACAPHTTRNRGRVYPEGEQRGM